MVAIKLRPAAWAVVKFEQEAALAHERRGTPAKALRAIRYIVSVELSGQKNQCEFAHHEARHLTLARPKNIECIQGYKKSFGQVQRVDKLLIVFKK